MMSTDDDLRAMLERRSGGSRPDGLRESARLIPDQATQRRAARGPFAWPLPPNLVFAAITPVVALFVLVAVVVSLAPAGDPDPASSLPIASQSPSIAAATSAPPREDSRRGSIDLEVMLAGGAAYMEGFFSYLRIEGPAGPQVIKLDDFKPSPTAAPPQEIEIPGGVGTATTSLLPGAYSLVSYQRPCSAACPPGGRLSEPMDSCQAWINIAAGDRIAVAVTVHASDGCTIDLERTAGPTAERPVVLCEAGLIGVAVVRPGCHGAIHEAVGRVRAPLPTVATAIASLMVCPETVDCPPVPDDALYRERVAWHVRFWPEDGGDPVVVLVPAEEWNDGNSGAIVTVNEPWEGPYNDTKAGATSQPSPDPSARSLGKPLRIGNVEVPLDRIGRWTVDLGEVVLPNGYHSETSFRVPNGGDGTYRAGLIWVDMVPLDQDAPGWDEPYRRLVDGPERFRAVLTFDLESYLPGAVMEIADLVVE